MRKIICVFSISIFRYKEHSGLIMAILSLLFLTYVAIYKPLENKIHFNIILITEISTILLFILFEVISNRKSFGISTELATHLS